MVLLRCEVGEGEGGQSAGTLDELCTFIDEHSGHVMWPAPAGDIFIKPSCKMAELCLHS